jgi:hypothetical protein
MKIQNKQYFKIQKLVLEDFHKEAMWQDLVTTEYKTPQDALNEMRRLAAVWKSTYNEPSYRLVRITEEVIEEFHLVNTQPSSYCQ